MKISSEIIEKYPDTVFGLINAVNLNSNPDHKARAELRAGEYSIFKAERAVV